MSGNNTESTTWIKSKTDDSKKISVNIVSLKEKCHIAHIT
jgi:hypothetical protein